jgi:hypothetical protein
MESTKTSLKVVNSEVAHGLKAREGAVACPHCHGEGYVRGHPAEEEMIAAGKEKRRKELQARDRWAAVGWGFGYVSLVLGAPALCGMLVQIVILVFWLIANLAYFAATRNFLDFPSPDVLGPPSMIGSVLGAVIDLVIISQVFGVIEELTRLWHQKDRRKPVDNQGLDE